MRSWKVEFTWTEANGLWLVVWVTAPDRDAAISVAKSRIKQQLGESNNWRPGRAREQH
jgi:hypothetical protein